MKTYNKNCFKTIITSVIVCVAIVLVGASIYAGMTNAIYTNDGIEVASAATTITTAADFKKYIQNGGSGDYVLGADITVSGYSTATFSGTLDGAGYKVTLSQSGNTALANNSNHTVGLVCGTLSGRIDNVNFYFNSSASFTSTHNSEDIYSTGSGNTTDWHSERKSYTVYAGIICGKITGRINACSLEIGTNGAFAAIGTDSNGGVKTWTYKTSWATSQERKTLTHAGGTGGVAGGVAAYSNGATIQNFTLKNNGSIYSFGENIQAGGVSGTINVPNMSLTAATDPERSVAGGLVGEIQAGSTSLINIDVQGSGCVGASLTSGKTSHTCNFAGLMVGSIKPDTTGTMNMNGVLFRASGFAYTNRAFSGGITAGTVIGGTNGRTANVNSFWRDTNSSDSSYSSRRMYKPNIYTEGSVSYSAANGAATSNTSTTYGNIFTNTACGGGALTYTSSEYNSAEMTYKGVSATTYGGSKKVTSIFDNNITVDVNSVGTYYLSAIEYGIGTTNRKEDATATVTRSKTFTISKSATNLKAHLAVVSQNVDDMTVSFSGIESGNEKVYDGQPITINGSAAGSGTLVDGVCWIAKCTSNDEYTTTGVEKSSICPTSRNVGTYTFVLSRINGDPLETGASMGTNATDSTVASIIYKYQPDPDQSKFTFSITEKEVSIEEGDITYVRDYDGTAAVGAIEQGKQYIIVGVVGEDDAGLKFDNANSYIANALGERDGNVGPNKKIILEGCYLTNPNYKLAGGNTSLVVPKCEILQRTADIKWTEIGEEEIIYVYNGKIQMPKPVIATPAAGDNNTTIYYEISTEIEGSVQPSCNVATYTARATLAGPAVGNYRLNQADLTIYSKTFKIVPAEIDLIWDNLELTYNANVQTVDCTIVDMANKVFQNELLGGQDVVTISKTFYIDGIQRDLKDVADYTAKATIYNDNNNYVIASGETCDGINVSPWIIDLSYYTYGSDEVENLEYARENYIDNGKGLFVKIATSGTELEPSDISLIYTQGSSAALTEVINKGEYLVTAWIPNNSNYLISDATNTCTLNVVAKRVYIDYGALEFTYDGNPKKPTAKVRQNAIIPGDGSVPTTVKTYKLVDGEEIEVEAIDAGIYICIVTLANPNYAIITNNDREDFEIKSYSLGSNSVYNSGIRVSDIADKEYNGLAYTPAITVTFDDKPLILGQDYIIDSYNANKDAGTATINIRGTGNYTGTIHKKFEILKKRISIDFNIANDTKITYQGKDISDTISVEVSDYAETDNAPELVVSFSNANGTATPYNVGVYTAKVSFMGGSNKNYELPSNTSVSFEIVKKTVSIIINGLNSNLVYDGTDKKAVIIAEFFEGAGPCDSDKTSDKLDINLIFSKGNNSGLEKVVDAGDYKVAPSLTGSSSGNYVIGNNSVRSFNVAQYQIYVKFTNMSHEYDGSKKGITCEVDESLSTISEDPDLSLSYRELNAQGAIVGVVAVEKLINAGTYLVTASARNTNYVVKENDANNPHQVRYTITRKKLVATIDIAEGSEFIYDGMSKDIPTTLTGVADRDKTSADPVKLTLTFMAGETLVETCINANDSYKVFASLDSRFTNYELDTETSVLSRNFVINRRPLDISISLDTGENAIYDAEVKAIVGALRLGHGRVQGDDNSGIIDSANRVEVALRYEYVGGGEAVPMDVGTYVAHAWLSGEDSVNYEIYNPEEKAKYEFEIVKKELSLVAKKGVSKVYGESEDSIDFTQTIDSGTADGQIKVTLIRDAGEEIGTYNYIDITYPEYEKNYEITLEKLNAERGTFEITKRTHQFTPKKFEKEYGDIDPELKEIITINTASQGIISIEVTYTRETGDNAGSYDLNETFEYENNNIILVYANEGASRENRFVIKGRSVTVSMDDYRKTYGDNDPDLYDNLVVEIDRLDASVKANFETHITNGGDASEFWKDIFIVARENGNDYSEEGYPISIMFKDMNYSVEISKTPRLYVDKFEITTPTIQGIAIEKVYDGKEAIGQVNLPDTDYYMSLERNASLRADAIYENANAGENKTIIVKFSVLDSLKHNYIIPEDVIYSTDGVIRKFAVDVRIVENDMTLTYGEIPTVTVVYGKFVGEDTAESLGLTSIIIPKYSDNKLLSERRNVGSYTVTLPNATVTNYILNTSQSINVRFDPKEVSVIARESFSKAEDGSLEANLTSANYQLVGVISDDVGAVDISYTALFDSALPGDRTVRMTISGLTGSARGNYNLVTSSLEIEAVIIALAKVELQDATYSYDTTQKTIVPTLTDVVPGTIYYVEYEGRSVIYEKTEVAPTNAGVYRAEVFLADSIDRAYYVSVGTVNLTIERITPTLTLNGEFKQVYGSFREITAYATAVGLSENVAVEYSFNEDGVTLTRPYAGEHTVSAYLPQSMNYNAVYVEKTLEIKQKALTVKFGDYSNLVYNGLERSDEIVVELVGVIEGDECYPVKNFGTATAVKAAGTYYMSISASNPSYRMSGQVSTSFTIAKAKLTVSAIGGTATAGGKPDISIKYEGFVPGDSEQDLTIQPSVPLKGGSVGVNSIIPSGGVDENYEFVYQAGTYEITYQPKEEKNENTIYYILAGIGGFALIAILGAIIGKRRLLMQIYKSSKK